MCHVAVDNDTTRRVVFQGGSGILKCFPLKEALKIVWSKLSSKSHAVLLTFDTTKSV